MIIPPYTPDNPGSRPGAWSLEPIASHLPRNVPGERASFDITTADDGDNRPAARRERGPVARPGGRAARTHRSRRGGAARFDHQPRVFEKPPHAVGNGRVIDGDHFVDRG